VKARGATGGEVADLVEAEVLPGWKEERELLEGLLALRSGDRILARLSDCMRLREEG